MEIPRVDRSDVGILVIDVQPFFVEAAFPDGGPSSEPLLVRLEHLLMLTEWLDLPLLATFEKPVSVNGELPERLEARFPAHGARFVKNHFGLMSEPEIRAGVAAMGVRQIAVAGAETDVCVLQSVLGLLEEGHQVYLLEDCLFTTEPRPGAALRRMMDAGAVPLTLKTLAYELAGCVDATAWYPEDWKPEEHPGARPFPEGFIVPEAWPPLRAQS